MSKTDPYRQGVDVFMGRVTGPLCPVAAVLAYLVRRGQRQWPLFLLEDGKGFTKARFVKEVKVALGRAGMVGPYKAYIKTPRKQLAGFSRWLAAGTADVM